MLGNRLIIFMAAPLVDQLPRRSLIPVFCPPSIGPWPGAPPQNLSNMGGILSTQGPASSRQTQLELVQHRRDSLEPFPNQRLHQLWLKHKSPGQNAADYDVLNELFLAALDSADVELAKSILDTVSQTFPPNESHRTMLMQGLLDEANGDRKRAEERYKTILKADETNIPALKRSITLLLNTNRTEAIDMLVKYLDTFADDQEAWQQLAGLYLDERCYNQAAFCMEELIMIDPTNHLYQIRMADILYTRGNHEQALKFYCKALELTPHPRALYGIQQTCRKLLSDAKSEKDTRLQFQWRDLQNMSKRLLEAKLDSTPSNDISKKWLSSYSTE